MASPFPPARNTSWDGDAGRVVRPYTMTTGRAGPEQDKVELTTLVSSVATRARPRGTSPEQHEIIRLSHRMGVLSVAEIAAYLDLPPAVVRVLLSDLLTAGAIVVRRPEPDVDLISTETLEAILHGLQAL